MIVSCKPTAACNTCVVIREGRVEQDFQRSYIAAGFAAFAVLTIVDLTSSDSIVLIPLLVLAPLIASGGTLQGDACRRDRRSSGRPSLLAGPTASAVADVIGWRFARRWSAALSRSGSRTREARDAQLAEPLPIMRRADRLKAALATGRMGEWSWDRRSGVVTWDANVAMLFGLDDGDVRRNLRGLDRAPSTSGTGRWSRLAVADGRRATRAVPVRPSLHVAGRKRPLDRRHRRCDRRPTTSGEVIGAFGLAIDIDERHREIEERNRLLEIERRQRERIEYLAKVNDVLAYSVDAGEIVQRVTQSVIPELAEWCSIVIAIDRRRDRPSITVAHRDPEMIEWAEQIQRDHPYDPDAVGVRPA